MFINFMLKRLECSAEVELTATASSLLVVAVLVTLSSRIPQRMNLQGDYYNCPLQVFLKF